VNFDRRAAASPRGRAAALALLLGALLALAAPAWASAAKFTVNGTGDEAKGEPGISCTTALGECTLRAAIEAANESSVGTDEIAFDPAVFNGEVGDTIAPGLLPTISTPTTLAGTGCNAGSATPCLAANNGNVLLVLSAGETKVQHLSITVPSGTVGIRASGSAGSGPGVEILHNTISMPGNGSPSTGIEVSLGASGDLVEGNKITSSLPSFNFPIALRGNSNRILGNELIGGSCCEAGVSLEIGASGNQIGGDTAASENLIEGFSGGAVGMVNIPRDSSHNEVRRNRGENGSNFVQGASVAAPLITEALQSSVSGTAEPEATVRLFRKKTESAGEIEGFLGEAEADSSGDWKVSFAKVPTDTLAAATQTVGGSTSGLGETKHLAEEPESAEEKAEKEQKAREEREAAEKAAREREAAEKGGGGSGSGTGTGSSSPQPAPTSPPAPAPVKPKVTITKGPKKASTSTTATFKFKATSAAGAKFECKLDRARWAKCKSPKTYKKLKPGRHAFRVRAKANGLTSAVAKYQFTVKRQP
jgi:CSLREA domain-containing protein